MEHWHWHLNGEANTIIDVAEPALCLQFLPHPPTNLYSHPTPTETR